MQKVYEELQTLDQRCYEKLDLSEDILMENAAINIKNHIKNRFFANEEILIVCGSYNNAADGLALARLLYDKYRVKIYMCDKPKSKMALLQYKRVLNLNITILQNLKTLNSSYTPNIIVDCIFGSGLNKLFDNNYIKIIDKLNFIKAYKIACDIPTGINKQGQIEQNCFKANTTITMGSLKIQLYNDRVKDYIGDIKIGSLGLSKKEYEKKDTNIYLLEKNDLKLPNRIKKDSNKGTYGYATVILGEKIGAGLLACESAFAFGVGLISVLSLNKNYNNIPIYIMQDKTISKKSTALAIGMGLGRDYKNELKSILLENSLPKVIDADLFYDEVILDILDQSNLIFTPHPKEFCSLLNLTNICDINIEQLQNSRIKYLKLFMNKYPHIVLLLKGANILIGYQNIIYINDKGSLNLAKGGSGDVLTGFIVSLLAQGYSTLDATISASLAHSIASQNYDKNSYSLNPLDIIEKVKIL
jgi:ADP-dependent NAD(P)H-hydrate dehydratase / NAD(P)H-hydrate epimerase